MYFRHVLFLDFISASATSPCIAVLMFTTFIVVSSLIFSTPTSPSPTFTIIPKNQTISTYDSTCFHYVPGAPQTQANDCLGAVRDLLHSAPSTDARKNWSALPGNRPNGGVWSTGTCEIGVVANWEPGDQHVEVVRDSFTLSQIAFAAANTIDQCVTYSKYKVGGRVPVGSAVFDVYVRPITQGQPVKWNFDPEKMQRMR